MKPLMELPDTPGARMILAERMRQQGELDHTAENDDSYPGRQLARAADCYACPPALRNMDPSRDRKVPVRWPWSVESWKPSDDRSRELSKAGALFLAQADKNMRAKQPAAERLSRIMAQRACNKLDRLLEEQPEVKEACHA